MSTFIEMIEEQATSQSTSSNSVKIFMLEKTVAELTGTVLVLKEELIKLKTELNEVKYSSSPKVNQTIESKLSLDANLDLTSTNSDNKPFIPNTTYYSTIKRIMEVKEYEHVGKQFQKYLLELVEKPGVYELHRDCALKPLQQGMKMSHQVENGKIKGYRIQYQ
jgi:hypothetical protein